MDRVSAMLFRYAQLTVSMARAILNCRRRTFYGQR